MQQPVKQDYSRSRINLGIVSIPKPTDLFLNFSRFLMQSGGSSGSHYEGKSGHFGKMVKKRRVRNKLARLSRRKNRGN